MSSLSGLKWKEIPVDKSKLIENIMDQYPNLAEALIVESMQNSIDSHAKNVTITVKRAKPLYRCIDDGEGMPQEEFERYHGIGFTSKDGKTSIGFRGWGNTVYQCGEMLVTETRSSDYRGAAVWRGTQFAEVDLRTLTHRGTMLEIRDVNQKVISDLTNDKIIRFIQRNYNAVLKGDIKIVVNKKTVKPKVYPYHNKKNISKTTESGEISGTLYYTKRGVPEEERGIAVSVNGKTISRTMFGAVTAKANKITGEVNADFLWDCVTSHRTEFKDERKWQMTSKVLRDSLYAFLKHIKELEESKLSKQEARELNKLLKNLDSVLKDMKFLDPRVRRRTVTAKPAVKDESGDDTLFEKITQAITPQENPEPGPGGGGGSTDPTTARELDKEHVKRKKAGRKGLQVGYIEETDQPESVLANRIPYINKKHPTFEKASKEKMRFYHELRCIVNELIRLYLNENELEEGKDRGEFTYNTQQEFFEKWAKIK